VTSLTAARAVGTVIGILFAATIHSIYALATIIVLLLPKTLCDLRAAESTKERDLDRWQGSNGTKTTTITHDRGAGGRARCEVGFDLAFPNIAAWRWRIIY
jgi:hypothetical protein